jgi:hypothetical protein
MAASLLTPPAYQPQPATYYQQPLPLHPPTAVPADQPSNPPPQPADQAPPKQPKGKGKSKATKTKPVVAKKEPTAKAQWNYPTTKILVDLWVEKHDKIHGSQRNLYWDLLKESFHQKTGATHITKIQMERKVLLLKFVYVN